MFDSVLLLLGEGRLVANKAKDFLSGRNVLAGFLPQLLGDWGDVDGYPGYASQSRCKLAQVTGLDTLPSKREVDPVLVPHGDSKAFRCRRRLKGLGGSDIAAMLVALGQLHEDLREHRVKAGRRVRNRSVLPETIMILPYRGWFRYDTIFKDKLFRQAD